MLLIFLRISDFFYSLFIRVGRALSWTASQWQVVLDPNQPPLPIYGTPSSYSSNPFYGLITGMGGTSSSYIAVYDNDIRLVYFVYQVVTAPLQLLGNLADILESVLENLGFGALPIGLDIDTLPMWVGIVIGVVFWGGILFAVKFLVKVMLR